MKVVNINGFMEGWDRNKVTNSIGKMNKMWCFCGSTAVQPLFPYYVSLLIHIECLNNTIMRTVIDEGIAAFMMSLSCLKGLGSPTLSQSTNMLSTFDGSLFRPHSIIPSLDVQLGGNTVMIEVEVVDAPLDYNLLLSRNWMYSMQAVASSLFRVVCISFNGNIVMIY